MQASNDRYMQEEYPEQSAQAMVSVLTKAHIYIPGNDISALLKQQRKLNGESGALSPLA